MIKGYFDGASRGNPGKAGAGAVICDGDKVLWKRAVALGVKTNNEAEYSAIGILVGELIRRGVQMPEIYGDSQLVISQVSGKWKIKEPRLKELALPIIARINQMRAKCAWIPREANKEADRLSNLAIDSGDFEEFLEEKTMPAVSDMNGTKKKIESNPAVGDDMAFKQVWNEVWLVSENNDVFVVDLAHKCCSCDQGRKEGKCRHISALRKKLQSEINCPSQ